MERSSRVLEKMVWRNLAVSIAAPGLVVLLNIKLIHCNIVTFWCDECNNNRTELFHKKETINKNDFFFGFQK